MAAGLGFKTFTTGEVLTAADTNGYLMQGVLVFASSAARAAAVTSPQEGQYSYLKDTNSTEYYDGAAWIAAPIGDITGVTAGTGISGGGTSGTVTVTNSMATEITAAGDIIVGTGSGTFDNLPIGTTAQVLTADTTVSPYKVKWATPAAATSGYTFITRSTFSAVATADIDNIFTSTYETYQIVIETCFSSVDSQLKMQLRYAGPNTQTADGYYGVIRRFNGTYTSDGGTNISNGTNFLINDQIRTGTGQASNSLFTINQVGNGSRNPILYGIGNACSFIVPTICNGYMATAREYTGIRLAAVSGNLTAQVSVYGLAKA